MELILVRHGETEGNCQRRYIGRTDLPLNKNGLAQADQLTQQFAEVNIDAVYSSPLLRAKQTADCLMAGITAGKILTPHLDNRLAELDFGLWDGLTYEEIEAQDRALLWNWYEDPFQTAPPQGESLYDLDARMTAWFAEATVRHAEETVLVVSHGGPLRWLLAKQVLENESLFSSLHLPPGGFVLCSNPSNTNGRWQLIKGEIERR